MPTEVVMPQMGESIAEGTVVRWIKKVGDKVDRDEPLFEISTDKVDAEVPSPAAGVVSEIRVKEGETVPVNSIVAVIGDAAAAARSATPAPTADRRPAADAPRQPAPEPPKPSAQADGGATPRPEPPSRPAATRPGSPVVAFPAPDAGTTEDAIRQRSSPLVRKIAKENNVDLAQIQGTGIGGRVTKDDILAYIGQEGREGRDGREEQTRQPE